MKKILSAVLVFIMLFSLAACGRNSNSNESSTSTEAEKDSDSGNKIPENTVSKETPSTGKGDSVQDAKIKLKFGNEEVIAKMYDNPTSRDLFAQLPLTITFEDYAGLEKIGYPPKALTREGAPSGADPKLGDLALYSPWGNLVIYYGDNKYADGVVILGHIESGSEKFAKMDQKFTLTIERMD
ncbi:hypothetical protein CPJCM30710_10580 [Clostridium polyendosporum]|uniref:Cyclophilin-like domain-containing protein n=1 Tax=Clostridium polyendosporum TaxID=69208 RepID=A0A919RXP9_9CLOT|nr:cyclophilin-like fold protein [Clostridium polyendosporum]GIM28392.1 hypothetical protein CPJCM30710_10580 [Clostridium polyendosporum]